MNKLEYAKFCKVRDKQMRSHRDANWGRNFMMHRFRHEGTEDRNNYSSNFDRIFPDAPGAEVCTVTKTKGIPGEGLI